MKNEKRKCNKNCLNKENSGNCLVLGSDYLPVQCVGPWAEDKYFFLERYLNATCQARKKFSVNNNSVFIDLFAGPGKCIIFNEEKEIDSGGIRALLRDEAPFSQLYYFDINKQNTEALKIRVKNNTKCIVENGDSNKLIKNLIKKLLEKNQKYHFAFIDPFGPSGLKFETLKDLSRLNRIDMLIHFPIGAIKRNYKQSTKNDSKILDEFLGTEEWRKKILKVSESKIFELFLYIFKNQLEQIGFKDEGLRIINNNDFSQNLPTVTIKNSKDVGLYALILASKHPLAQRIWNDIIKIDSHGQRQLF